MDHAPAPSWLDRHLDHRPGWADAPADGVEIDPSTDAAAAAALDESPAPAGDSWLGDAMITGLTDDVDQIEITEDDLAARDDVDTEFAVPTASDTVSDTDSEPSLVDPFDEFVAETEAQTEELPDPTVDTDDTDDVVVDDIAPAPADPSTATPPPADSDDAGPADTGVGPYDAFDSFDVAEDAPGGDAVADGVGATDPSWTSEPSGDDAADSGYDAFDDLDEGTDG
ncbi:hypothetical protein BDK89_0236 [Ilumatobacter fluminis]|uniref:Uncharacterized protein n=1 Tax=Ilumatobacter fluminis TaxID=467091 RepID=A0A4R7HUP9_9ACTN|nr:hypothetical protein [Ilumatobacter fluminis]TDT14681.1 hypothetical protein BDK89_0236 [Ilumatobacter fluminis]